MFISQFEIVLLPGTTMTLNANHYIQYNRKSKFVLSYILYIHPCAPRAAVTTGYVTPCRGQAPA